MLKATTQRQEGEQFRCMLTQPQLRQEAHPCPSNPVDSEFSSKKNFEHRSGSLAGYDGRCLFVHHHPRPKKDTHTHIRLTTEENKRLLGRYSKEQRVGQTDIHKKITETQHRRVKENCMGIET